MSWSARLWFVAFFAAMQMAFAGCGSSWKKASSHGDSEFLSKQRAIRTIDIMPLDVQLWTYHGNKKGAEALGQTFHSTASGTTLSELSQRGYQVVAEMDWDGSYDSYVGKPRAAMTQQDIENTADALATYGRAVRQSGNQLVTPLLPARLGTETGSDATLYISGWSYVGKRGDGTGKKVAKGIAIGILVVALFAVIVLVAVGSKGKGGGGGKGGGKLGGRSGGGGSGIGAGVGRGVGKGVVTVGRAAGRATGHVLRGIARSGPNLMRGTAHVGRGFVDAFGRSNTHIDLNFGGGAYYQRPDYYLEPDTPKKGKSEMYLEMTLIDNRTGNVIWHAQQNLRADGSKPKQVRRAVSHMMATLPGA